MFSIACWREVILPNESIRKGASIGKERILHFWNMLSLWSEEKENRLFGRLKCLLSVPLARIQVVNFVTGLRNRRSLG